MSGSESGREIGFLAGLPPLPGRAVHSDWQWQLAAMPAQLWPLVSNTDRFNHDVGLPLETILGEERIQGIPLQSVEFRALGQRLRLRQRPFEWVEPHYFSVYRVFETGPVHTFRVHCALTPSASGSLLRYQVWHSSRSSLAQQLVTLQLRASQQRFGQVFQHYDGLAVQIRAAPTSLDAGLHPVIPGKLSAAGHERLTAAIQQLPPVLAASKCAALLKSLIEHGDDLLVSRLRPYALARLWGMQGREVLELCLWATRAGLLDLRWDLLCPLCRGVKESALHLAGVKREVHCSSCNIDFEVNFEQQVELSFRVNAAVRPADDALYCAGAPNLTPHICVQQVLGPGEVRSVTPQLEAGRYRLRSDGARGGSYLRIEPGARQELRLGVNPADWAKDEALADCSPRIELRNCTDRAQLVMLERLAWADDAVTAAEVTSLQLFRDLFSSEALRPGEQISVGRVSVLFTDLVASTRLYREIGDAPAFGRVMEHFDVLRDEIGRAGGAIVKTIGDAVLAVFVTPLPAIRAMLAVQQRLALLDPPLLLKAGLHCGPCIAVTLNERLDYFGTTVNFASRLAHAAQGLELIVSGEVAADPEVSRWLESQDGKLVIHQVQTELKGFEEVSPELWKIQATIPQSA